MWPHIALLRRISGVHVTSLRSTEEDLWCSCDLNSLQTHSGCFDWQHVDVFHTITQTGQYSEVDIQTVDISRLHSSLYEQHWRILSSITSRASYVPHLKPKVEGPLALKSPVSCYRSNKSFKMKWNCAKCIWSLAEADRGCVTNGWLSLSCAMFVPTLLIMLRHWPRLDCNSHTFCSISLLEIFDIFWIVFQFWSLTLSLHLFSVLKMSTFLLNFCQLSRDFRLETSCF